MEIVQALDRKGLNRCEIARKTGIPRPTVRDWLTGKTPRGVLAAGEICGRCGNKRHDYARLPLPEYTYLLGVYLGDGCISTSAKGVHVLRLFQDNKYVDLIDDWAGATKAVMPDNSVRAQYNGGAGGCATVVCSSKSWPCLFPQHGAGRKHERPIFLSHWQQRLVDEDPRPLVAGLIHSDGCRVINRSMGHEYPRYMFTNASADIRRIFCDGCDQLGIRWRQSNARNISIARREDVTTLDSFVGPKS